MLPFTVYLKFVACLYTLSFTPLTCKAPWLSPSKELDIATVPVKIEGNIEILREFKGNTFSTWFKDASTVPTKSN